MEKVRALRKKVVRHAQQALAGFSTYLQSSPDRLAKLLREADERIKSFPNIEGDYTWVRRSDIEAAEVEIHLLRCVEGTLKDIPVSREVFSHLKRMLNPNRYVPDALKGLAERLAQVPEDQDMIELRVSSDEAETLLEGTPRYGGILAYCPCGILDYQPVRPPRILPEPDGSELEREPWRWVCNLKSGRSLMGPTLGGPGTEPMLICSPRETGWHRPGGTFYLVGIRNAVKCGADQILFELASPNWGWPLWQDHRRPKRSYIELSTNSEIRVYLTYRAAVQWFVALCDEACRENPAVCRTNEPHFIENPSFSYKRPPTHIAVCMKGTIKRVIRDRGFGFIRSTDGQEVFFHRSSLQQLNFDGLKEGETVEFEMERDEKGPRATNVRPSAK